jgi:adenosylcobyric acid synthase
LFEGLEGIEVTGYEIHMGKTRSQNHLPAFEIVKTPRGKTSYFDGAIGDSGLVFGSYLHGLFHNTGFTQALLNRLRQLRGLPATAAVPINKDAQYDELARLVRQNLNMREVYKIVLGRDYG